MVNPLVPRGIRDADTESIRQGLPMGNPDPINEIEAARVK